MKVLETLKGLLKPSPPKKPPEAKAPAAAAPIAQLKGMSFQEGAAALRPAAPPGVGPRPTRPAPRPPGMGAEAKPGSHHYDKPLPALPKTVEKPPPAPPPALDKPPEKAADSAAKPAPHQELSTIFESPESLAPVPASPALTWQGENVGVGGAAYTRGKELGRGQMGAVNLLDPQAKGADPLVMKTALGDQTPELRHEALVQQRLGSHPNVVKAVGTVEQKGQFGLVQEFVGGGNLEKGLDELKKMHDSGLIGYGQYMGTVQYLMKGVMAGFAHLESMGVTHRDIKPDNIMLDDKTLQPKIADFGTSTLPEDTGPDPDAGNVEGRGPEALKVGGKAVPKSDVWAGGMMMHRIGEGKGFKRDGSGKYAGYAQHANLVDFGKNPANRALNPMTPEQKAAGKGKKAPGTYGAETAYTDFMNQTLGPTPETRISAADAQKHPFLKDAGLSDEQAQAVLRQMLDRRAGVPKAPVPNAAPNKAWGIADQHKGTGEKPGAPAGSDAAPKSKQVVQQAQNQAVADGKLTPKAAKKVADQRKKVLTGVRKFKRKQLAHALTNDRSAPMLEKPGDGEEE